MGQEISQTGAFNAEHFERFRNHLNSEMQLLRKWFSGSKFCDDHLQCGLELEAWLIGKDGRPVPDNSLFLSTLDRKSVVPELSKFNFELNVSPQYIAGQGLQNMHAELVSTWDRCRAVARRLEHRIVSIGILPTVTDAMLCIDNMSSLQRYAALNEQVLRLRNGKPIRLEIEGTETLCSSHHDLMLESAATSIQVHLKIPPSRAVRFYNASVIASSLTVAMAANAPLLFGRRLWDDTRITLFEQAVDTAGPSPRVSFGHRYIEDSLLELFEDNVVRHRVLLPAELDEPPARMPHVRMHNGTIWNWNRPLIGFESDGSPHLRIEHRPMSASPSLTDLFADVAFYLGVAHDLASVTPRPESKLSFDTARRNFYLAARFGFDAEIDWIDGRRYCVADLLPHVLVRSLESMSSLGIPSAQIAQYAEVLQGRIETRQNGARWQRRKFAEYDGDLHQLLLEYEARQFSGAAVHTWN